MVFRTESWSARLWAALALGCVLVLGGCSGDDAGDADGQTEPAQDEVQDEQAEPAQDDEQGQQGEDDADEQAAGDAEGDCLIGPETVSDVVGLGLGMSLEDVNEIANGGLSCIYEGEDDEVAVIVASSFATWNGTDERVEQVVSQTAEFYGEPVANPDLGDRAFLFDDDFGGTSLVVFVDDRQYSSGISGAGWGGTPLESLDERQRIVTELHQQAAG